MNILKRKALALATAALIACSVLAGCSATTETTPTSTSAAAAMVTAITAAYTTEDLNSPWDASTASTLTLSDRGITVKGSGAAAEGSTLTISEAGTYVVSGTLTDGQILVNAGKEDAVKLVLSNVSITNTDGAAIESVQSGKLIITLAEGTQNTVKDGVIYADSQSEDSATAPIFSTDDLTLNGTGSLSVTGQYKNGIVTKDNLVITGGNITVTAVNDGLQGRDSVAIKDGTLTIKAGSDGVQANNDEDTDKGWISLDGGTVTITAGSDGIQAETLLQVIDGTLSVTTGGGSVNASTDDRGEVRPQWGQQDSDESDIASETETISAKALKAGTDLLISGGTLTIDSSDDAIHANNNLQVTAGQIAIASGDDGIHADALLTIDGGDITISKSYEGIEGNAITVNNGTIHLTAQDDGFNAAGSTDGSSTEERPGASSFSNDSDSFIQINGGYISLDANGDGIDSNGSISFTGGTVLVNGPTNNGNGPMDYNGTCILTGGTLAIAGSSGMAQAPGDTSTQNAIAVYYTDVQDAGTLVTLQDDNGDTLLSYAPSKDYQSVVISTSALEKGKTYTLFTGGNCTGQVKDGLYTGGTLTGGIQLTEIALSAAVTSIADDGSAVTRNSMSPPSGAPTDRPARPNSTEPTAQ